MRLISESPTGRLVVKNALHFRANCSFVHFRSQATLNRRGTSSSHPDHPRHAASLSKQIKDNPVHDEEHLGSLFALLHSPLSYYGINRTSLRMEGLHNILAAKGHRISERRIRRIIKARDFRWRKAKTVLTSNDPQYQSKMEAIKGILSEPKPDEAFVSI